MEAVVKEYDAKIDSKKRFTLRTAMFEYYHVEEYSNGRIVLEPRVLTEPFEISEKSLAMADSAIENIRKGKVSERIDLSAFED